MKAILFAITGLGLAVGTCQSATLAQERRAARQADAALQQQEEKLAQAEKKVEEAQTALRKATNEVAKAHASAAQEQARKLGLDRAKTERVAALAALNKQRDTVITALKGSDAYQRARQEADEALRKIQALSSDSSGESAARQKQISELTPLTKRPMELEAAALKGDESMKAAALRLSASEQRLAALQKAYQKAVEEAPAVQRARAEASQAEAALKEALRMAQDAGKDVRAAGKNAAQADKQVQQKGNAVNGRKKER